MAGSSVKASIKRGDAARHQLDLALGNRTRVNRQVPHRLWRQVLHVVEREKADRLCRHQAHGAPDMWRIGRIADIAGIDGKQLLIRVLRRDGRQPGGVLYGARGPFAGRLSLDRIGQQMPSDSQRIGEGIDAKTMSDNANDFYIIRFGYSAGDHALNPGLRDPPGIGCDAMYHLDDVFRQILQTVVFPLDRIWR